MQDNSVIQYEAMIKIIIIGKSTQSQQVKVEQARVTFSANMSIKYSMKTHQQQQVSISVLKATNCKMEEAMLGNCLHNQYYRAQIWDTAG